MKKKVFFLLILFLLSIYSNVFCQVAKVISYQGLLSDNSGKYLLNGNYSIEFMFYDDKVAGNKVWSEVQTVNVSNGIFNVLLGSVNPLNLNFDKLYYVSIKINGGSELLPRLLLSPSLYSFAAQSVFNNSIKKENIPEGQVLKSINSLTDAVSFEAGENISLKVVGSKIVVSANTVVGPKGDTGAKGDKGDKGESGIQGEKGAKGDQGLKGEKGDQGSKGEKGDSGTQGTKGDRGDSGVQGLKGEKGEIGVQGFKGDRGDRGDKGDRGTQGDRGDKGDQGFKGDKGDQGFKGDKGDQGFKGDKGDQGLKGDKGDQGLKGDKGDQGLKGDKGDQGIQGTKGDKGDKGESGATHLIVFISNIQVDSGLQQSTKVQEMVMPIDGVISNLTVRGMTGNSAGGSLVIFVNGQETNLGIDYNPSATNSAMISDNSLRVKAGDVISVMVKNQDFNMSKFSANASFSIKE